jgi:hypothetical protein
MNIFSSNGLSGRRAFSFRSAKATLGGVNSLAVQWLAERRFCQLILFRVLLFSLAEKYDAIPHIASAGKPYLRSALVKVLTITASSWLIGTMLSFLKVDAVDFIAAFLGEFS